MSAEWDAFESDAEWDLEQEGLAFLHQARRLGDFRPGEVEQIARRLDRRDHNLRRVLPWPALAVFGLVLVAGATFAVAKVGLGSLPIVGPFLGPLFVPEPSTGESKFRKHPPSAAWKLGAADLPDPGPGLPAVQPIPAPTETAPAPGLVRVSEPEPVTTARLAAHSVRPLHPIPWHRVAPRDSGKSPESVLTGRLPGVPPLAAEEKQSPIAEESRSFASVIEPWNRTRDASTTLTLLDAHERRYPSGTMQLESRVLRAEIYLAQAREREALSVLDTLSLAGLPRARELHTVRGELRIRVGRCADGRRDLDEVLAKDVADALAKRAARAISQCP